MKPDLTILEQAVIAGITVADETWRRIRALAALKLPEYEFMPRLRAILEAYEPILARTLSDSMVAAWVDAQIKTIDKAGLQLKTTPGTFWDDHGHFGPPTLPPIPPPPEDVAQGLAAEPEPVIVYPKIIAAVNDLAQRRIITADEYYALDGRAKRLAFTVSKIGTEDVIEKIRDLVTESVRTGGTLKTFADAVAEVEGASALSGPHLETVFRTNVMASYSEGQQRILANEIVKGALPYLAYIASRDDRTRPEHRAMETNGIQGTRVYNASDPVAREFFPPWSFNCRCHFISCTIETAAERYGIAEAIEWMKSGHPPQFPTFVEHPPFSPPPGWTHGAIAMSFDETKHPRGQPGNAGEFAKGGAAKAGKYTVKKEKYRENRGTDGSFHDIWNVYDSDGKKVNGSIYTSESAAHGLVDRLEETAKAKSKTHRTPEQAAKEYKELGTKSPAFKAWFGKSKVADKSGEPLVVYHGTDDKFDTFKMRNPSSAGRFNFSTDENYFERIGSSRRSTMRVYLAIQNPKILKRIDVDRIGAGAGDDDIKKAKEEGHDGIMSADKVHMIAFEPHQIKAVDNAGTFDPSNASIKLSAS